MSIPVRAVCLRAALIALSFLVFWPVARADTKITMRVQNSGLAAAGRPAQDGQHTIWLGDGVARTDQDRSASLILDGPHDKLYVVNHEDRVYHTLDLPVDLSRSVPPEMVSVMKEMRMKIDLQPSEERRKIGGRDARLYRLEADSPAGMTMSAVLWMVTDVPIDTALFKRLRREVASLTPVGRDWMHTVQELEGVAVLTEATVSMRGSEVTHREELLSIETQEPPAGTYGPPADYVEAPYNPAASRR